MLNVSPLLRCTDQFESFLFNDHSLFISSDCGHVWTRRLEMRWDTALASAEMQNVGKNSNHIIGKHRMGVIHQKVASSPTMQSRTKCICGGQPFLSHYISCCSFCFQASDLQKNFNIYPSPNHSRVSTSSSVFLCLFLVSYGFSYFLKALS